MKKERKTRRSMLKYFGGALLLWAAVIGAVLVAQAAAVTTSGTFNGVENYSWLSFSADNDYKADNGKVAISANEIAVSAIGYEQTSTGCGGGTTEMSSTTTLTITNKQPSAITVTYTTTGGTASEASPVKIANGGSMTFKVTSGKGSSSTVAQTITITKIEPYYETYTTTFGEETGGSYTVSYNGSSCTVPGSHSKTNQYSYELMAMPDDGYEFVAWVNGSYEQISTANPYAYIASSDQTISPMFRPKGTSTYYILGAEGIFYYYLDDAISAAGSSGTIVVYAGGSVCGSQGQTEFTIPSGVTLLLPYAFGSNTVASSNDKLPYANYLADSSEANVNTSCSKMDPYYKVYLTLTVPQSMVINNNGKIVLGGQILGVGYAGACYGPHSNLQLDGEIVMGDSAILSAVGYVLGDGKVTATGSGAAIYQPLVICDYRGGGYTVGAAGSSYAVGSVNGEEKYISPFVRYSAQNIQTDIEIRSGNTMYAYCDLVANSQHNLTTGVLIGQEGSSTDAMIKLASEATLYSSYDPDDVVSPYTTVGKTTVRIEGGATYGALKLVVEVSILSADVNTTELNFPVPYNYEFQLAEGTYNIGYSMSLYPGAKMVVEQGATLNVGNSSSGFRFVIFDGLYDHSRTPSSSKNPYTTTYGSVESGKYYPTTANLQAAGRTGTADLIVNGTLNILSGVHLGGVIQTEGSGTLIMDAGATPNATAQVGLVGSYEIDMFIKKASYYFAGATVRTLTAQIVDTSTGQRTDIVSGKTYYGAVGDEILQSYTYTLYTDSSSTAAKEEHTENLNALVEGSWWNYEIPVSMVDANGNILSTVTMRFADGVDVSNYYTDQMCTIAATTVSEATKGLYSNDVEARIEWADGSSATYYASLRSAVKDAVNPGDTVILMQNIVGLDKSIPIDVTQDVIIKLDDDETAHTIAYVSTPFINGGTLTLDLGGGTITNCVDGAYVSAPAFTNNDGGTASIDLNGGSMIVQAPVGQGAQFNAVVNYGTLSVADTAGNGGIYCYGPLGADESGWKDITLTTNLGGTPTATVKAEIYANTLAAETIYTGIYNTGTITEISGGTIRSPMYGVYSGSAAAVAYRGSYDLAKAKIAAASAASIGSISGGIFQGGYAGLMNDGASIGSITGGTFESTGTMFVSDASANYSGLYNAFGTVGNVSNASFLSNDAFTLTRYRFTFNAGGIQGGNTTNTTTNSVYGIYNYGALWTDTTAAAGYSYFAPTLGNLTNCTIEAVGTELASGVLNGSYTGTYTGTVNNANGTALMNYGTVGNITGGSITGNRGILNYNILFAPTVYNTGSSSNYTRAVTTRRVVSVGTIGDIRDCEVTAYYQYALLNYGTVGSLCGSSTFTSYSTITNSSPVYGYAVYNHGGRYNGTVSYQTITEREAYTNASSSTAYRNTKVTNVYDDPGMAATGLDDAASVWTSIPLPTIDSIADGVTITSVNNTASAAYGYALSNAGRINSIGGGTGTVTIQTYNGDSATVSTSNYGLYNSAYIGSIGGNVKISATGERAIQNSSNRLTQQVTTYTYATDDAATVKATDVVYNYCVPAYIGSIGAATVSAGTQYGILNCGWIGSLEGTTVTATTNYGISNQGDSSASYLHTLTYAAAYAPTGYNPDDPGYFEEGIRFGAKIGTITDAKISATVSSNYASAVLNNGEIGAITGNTTITDTSTGDFERYALYNGDSYQKEYSLKRYNLGKIDSLNAARYITLEEKTYSSYVEGGPVIGEISGNVNITNGCRRAIYNGGTINSIDGATLTAYSYALDNSGTHYTTRTTFRYLYGTSVLGISQYIGEQSLSYTRVPAKIGTISNVTASTTTVGYALRNLGAIETIDGGSFTAKSGVALYNVTGVTQSYVVNLPESPDRAPGYLDYVSVKSDNSGYTFTSTGHTTSSDYSPAASIGTIKNARFTGTTYAIQNGDGNTNYPGVTIGELGEGVEATSTGSHAVYLASNYAKIEQITGGIYTATASGKYAVYNAGTANPIAISAGDFKGGTNTDSTQGRAYAIYNPDDTARQTYPKDMSLTPAGRTRTVTFADGTTADGYYYIGILNPVAQIINGGGLTEYTSLAQAVAAYTVGVQTGDTDTGLPYIQMMDNSEEPGFTISTDVYLDLNGKTVTLTDGGTLTIEAGAVLYGMDTATDGYSDESYGKIVGTVSGSVAAAHETFRKGATRLRYVTYTDTSSSTAVTSFHRFNMSVTSYTFHFSLNGDCNMAFGATFRGSQTVVKLVQDMGFRVVSIENGVSSDNWYVKQFNDLPKDLADKTTIQGTLVNLGVDGGASQFTDTYQIYALLKFGDEEEELVRSVARQINYLGALKTYYNSGATEEQKAAIENFVEKWALQDAWGN